MVGWLQESARIVAAVKSPQCVQCWVVCARPLLITVVCMCISAGRSDKIHIRKSSMLTENLTNLYCIDFEMLTNKQAGVQQSITFSLFGAMASNSSIKMIAGAFFSASSNALRRLLSDSPANLLIISGPLMRKKNAPVSLATALAISVLPVPGGPYSIIPRGGCKW